MKYDYEDIIVDPEDERVEIGAEYFAAITPAACLRCANSTAQAAELKYVERDKDRPFFLADAGWSCIIRKKEPEKKYVPYDFSDPDVRSALLEKYVKFKEPAGWVQEGIITAFMHESDNIWRCSIGGMIKQAAEQLMELWTYRDGSPCGKEVENG